MSDQAEDTSIHVGDGYLLFLPARAAVPVGFWDRVKERARAAGLAGELRAEYLAAQAEVFRSRTENLWWGAPEEMDLERLFFRRWVLRLFGEPALWPWQRGWTEDLVDSYLTAPMAAQEAA